MTPIRLFVFGAPRLERNGEPVDLGLRKAMALCVYLAVTRQPHSRDTLATLFWPEQDQREARASLRRTLHRLTSGIGDDVIFTNADTVACAHEAAFWVDVADFEQRVSAGDPQAALELYRDDFLAGFTLPDSPAFDEWQFFERERLRQQFANLLAQQVQAAQAREDWLGAADYARRWVALDGLHEPAQRTLLRIYAALGHTALAQRQYQELTRILADELGVEPEAETQELYEAIRSRRLPGPTAAPPPATVSAPASAALAPTLPLVGRERELNDLVTLLSSADGARLVTLIGPGGAGKTRLAQAVAEQFAGRFTHGTHLVSLLEVTTPTAIIPSLAAALRLPLGSGDVTAHLFGILRDRSLLLVLDNFEHLLDATPIVAALLDAAPQIRLLITSRERLGLGQELVYALGGLTVPAEDAEDETLESGAAQLLLQRARLVRPDLEPGPTEIAAIRQICRMVQGMPLALTLAASWAELLSFAEIGVEIARSLAFLRTDQQDLPERQRSVEAVFVGSWERLPPAAQQTFVRLTVFRGGFTRRAAEAVAGADLPTLRRLLNSSFLTANTATQRYEIHALLRLFAAEQSAHTPAIAAALHAHSTYFLGALCTATPDLRGAQQQEAFAALWPDYENLQHAWQTAVAQANWSAIAAGAEGLCLLGEMRGASATNEQLFAQAVAAAEADPHVAGGLRGVLLAAYGYFNARNNRLGEGYAQMERGVALLREAGPDYARPTAFALIRLGLLARFQEQFLAAERIAEESLARFAELEDHPGVASSLLLMGIVAEYCGRPGLARHLFQTCFDRAAAIGATLTQSVAAQGLGRIMTQLGDYQQAEHYLRLAVAAAEQFGDPISVGIAYHECGQLAFMSGEHDRAAAAFTASSRALARLDNPWSSGPALADQALADALHGDEAARERLAQLALQAAQGNFERWHAARLLVIVGQLTTASAAPAAAELFFRESARLAAMIAHEPALATAEAELAAQLAIGADPAPEARELLHHSLELALRHQLAPVALTACLAAAPLLQAQGDAELATALAALVAHHAATPAATRARAVQYVRSAVGQAPPEPTVTMTDWRAATRRLLSALTHPAASTGAAPPTNLDRHRAPLIGRDLRLAEMQGLLSLPARRVITLLGPGGIGKSHLAQEAGLASLDHFPAGVFFVALAPLDSPTQIVGAIAAALGFRFSGAGPAHEQLIAYLRPRQLLLILDNFEHLLAGVDLVQAIVQATPHVNLLVTSRERLNLADELVVPLDGIEVPPDRADPHALERGAVQLLLQRARLARPDLELSTAEFDAVIEICQRVDGMPLALILAASWADMLSFRAIADEIARSLDVLAGELRDLPPRQRSVRAIFDLSWQRLPATAQRAFARLALFRGGFTRAAAEQVADVDLRTLRSLLNTSFIMSDAAERFTVHELLRQYGLERLAELGETERRRERHRIYFLDLLRDLESDLRRKRQVEAFEALAQDLDNIRMAWAHALDHRDVVRLDAAIETLFLFGEKRGHYWEIVELLAQVRDQLAPTPEHNPQLWQRLTARLSLLQSRAPREGQIPLADLEQSLALARASGATAEEALTCLAVGMYYARTENDYARALAPCRRAYDLHTALDDRFYVVEDLARVGICHGYLGDLEAFYTCCQEGYTIAQTEDDKIGMITATSNLIEALLHQGRYAEVLDYGRRQLVMAETLGMRTFVGQAQQFVALMYLLHGNFAAAREVALAGYLLSSELNSALSMGINLSTLSLHAGVSGDYPLALRFADEALAHPLNLLGMIQLYWSQTLAYCGLERYSSASSALHTAFATASRFATPVTRVWLLPVAALLAARRGQPERAVELLALARTYPLSAHAWIEHTAPLRMLRPQLEDALDAAAFTEAWARGTALDITTVTDL
jgi:predicted ATPase/DNA-binding SARP family transcriptional activator